MGQVQPIKQQQRVTPPEVRRQAELSQQIQALDAEWQHSLKALQDVAIELAEQQTEIDRLTHLMKDAQDMAEDEAFADFLEDAELPKGKQRFSNETLRKHHIAKRQREAAPELTRQIQAIQRTLPALQVRKTTLDQNIQRVRFMMDAIKNDLYALAMVIRFHLTAN